MIDGFFVSIKLISGWDTVDGVKKLDVMWLYAIEHPLHTCPTNISYWLLNEIN